MNWSLVSLTCLTASLLATVSAQDSDCPADFVSFEVVTGELRGEKTGILQSSPL